MSTFSYIGRSDWNRLPLSHAAWTAGMQALYHRACLLELWESTRVKNATAATLSPTEMPGDSSA
jgi:hypothetical protein